MPGGTDDATMEALERAGLVLQATDSPILLSAGLARDWPDARGVFAGAVPERGLSAIVNEDDHLKLQVSQKGSDLRAAFEMLCSAEQALQMSLEQQGHVFACNTR